MLNTPLRIYEYLKTLNLFFNCQPKKKLREHGHDGICSPYSPDKITMMQLWALTVAPLFTVCGAATGC